MACYGPSQPSQPSQPSTVAITRWPASGMPSRSDPWRPGITIWQFKHQQTWNNDEGSIKQQNGLVFGWTIATYPKKNLPIWDFPGSIPFILNNQALLRAPLFVPCSLSHLHREITSRFVHAIQTTELLAMLIFSVSFQVPTGDLIACKPTHECID